MKVATLLLASLGATIAAPPVSASTALRSRVAGVTSPRAPRLSSMRSNVQSTKQMVQKFKGSMVGTTNRAAALIPRAQEVDSPSSLVPFIAPPLALAAGYALIKSSPLEGALTSFIEGGGYPEMFRGLDMPGFFYKWFHAANMAIVAGAMGGYGAFLGFETKAGRGNEVAWGGLNGATKRELHSQLMAGAGLIFAAGGLGGVTFMLTLQKTLFESPHAVTGLAELFLFATQGALAVAMKENPNLRQAHATLGAITMGILTVHAALGIKLGLGL